MWTFRTMKIVTIILSHFVRYGETQESELEIILARGTNGFGVHLVSETRGSGAVVDRVVPGSAATLVLQAGDALTAVAGVDIRHWALDSIERLLQIRSRVKLRVRRRAEATPKSRLYGRDGGLERGAGTQISTASCYASINEETDDVHALACAPATFGADLPAFSMNDGLGTPLPVMIAKPLEYCTRNPRVVASGHALLVSRGGCLPHVKAQNAARSGAEVLLLADGQFPPYPPLPRTAGIHALPRVTSTHPSAQGIEIPVLLIRNETGHIIMQKVQGEGGEVQIFCHAGGRPYRSSIKPRNQQPLAIAERLDAVKDAFSMASAFRDGAFRLAFGTPGLLRGKTSTIHLQAAYELSAALKEIEEVIHFERAVLCPVCGGSGALQRDMRPCKSCSSSDSPGILRVTHDHGQEVKQTTTATCSHCHGFGEVPKRGTTCPRCNGSRVLRERASLTINIPRGAPDPHALMFPIVGSQSPGKMKGDVEVGTEPPQRQLRERSTYKSFDTRFGVVAKARRHDVFTREGANLKTELNITVMEALSGFTRELILLNGTSIILNVTGVTNHKDELEIVGGGLPHWGIESKGTRAHGGDNVFAPVTAGAREHRDELAAMMGSAFVVCTVVFPQNFGERSHVSADSATVRSDQPRQVPS